MSSTSIPTSVFLSFLILSVCSVVHGGNQSYTATLDITSLQATNNCSNTTGRGPNAMEMVHSYGACAPPGMNTSLPGLHDLMVSDQLRLAYLSRTMGMNGSDGAQFPSQLTLQSVSMGALTLVIPVFLGPQKARQIVIADTGSDLCWVPCTPCTGVCHKQMDPIYTPSTYYSKVTCPDRMCSALGKKMTCPASECVYNYEYGDKSTSQGILGRETLTLTPTDQIPNFVFGCTRTLTGNTVAKLPQDGLFGMGRGPLSLISQVAPRYGKVFSFCIPRSSSSTGYLELGPSLKTTVYYTPMLTCSLSQTHYFIDLTGISVSGVMLSIPPVAHAPCTTIIDSGTALTKLHPSIYTPLAQAFTRGMSTYRLSPQSTPDLICYDITGLTTITVPGINLYFRGGVGLKLDSSQILFVLGNIACLGFSPSTLGINIIGYTQQKMYTVIYDSRYSRIGFGPGSC